LGLLFRPPPLPIRHQITFFLSVETAQHQARFSFSFDPLDFTGLIQRSHPFAFPSFSFKYERFPLVPLSLAVKALPQYPPASSPGDSPWSNLFLLALRPGPWEYPVPDRVVDAYSLPSPHQVSPPSFLSPRPGRGPVPLDLLGVNLPTFFFRCRPSPLLCACLTPFFFPF